MNAENNIGKKIKQVRKSMGLTQEQFAEMAGIDNKHLSKIENGLHLPAYKTLLKLSQIFNINFDEKSVKENNNTYYLKAMKILNSASNEKENEYYYEILKLAQKGIKLGIEQK